MFVHLIEEEGAYQMTIVTAIETALICLEIRHFHHGYVVIDTLMPHQ